MQTVDYQTSDPVRYRVVVRGRLGEGHAGVFEQLEIEPRPGQTSLTGNFADQAQLHGLLDQLRDLGIHLISVNPVDQAPTPQLYAGPAHAFESSGCEPEPGRKARSK